MKGFFFGGIDVYILILVSINVNTNCWIFHGLLKIHFDVILRKRSAWHRPPVRSVPAASLAPALRRARGAGERSGRAGVRDRHLHRRVIFEMLGIS
jgi:hypothetical protein